MPDKGVGPSQGLIARLLAMIMGSPDRVSTGQGQDIYLSPEGPSLRERMDMAMRPPTGPLPAGGQQLPSLGPSAPPIARPNPEMEQIERLRKRNEILGRLNRGGVRG